LGLKVMFLALSALSALKSISRGESSWRAGMAMGARDGEGVGLAVSEPELLSGGGVGGLPAVFAGTERDRNLGMGKAEGAGDAWKVGPA
jgi:hypothetical protein